MKRIKKFIILVVCLILCIQLFGCQDNSDIYIIKTKQISEYNPETNTVYGSVQRLLPLEEESVENSGKQTKSKYSPLVCNFAYTDGLYIYQIRDAFPFPVLEKCFMYITYDENTYEQVKNYIFYSDNGLNWIDSDSLTEYNGYYFYNSYFDENETRQYSSSYLAQAGYNDGKKTLIFYAMCCERDCYPEHEYFETDFGRYLKSFFGDYYDFDAGQPVTQSSDSVSPSA